MTLLFFVRGPYDISCSGSHDGQHSLCSGLIDGREVGFAKGFEIGQEIGFYSGCHAVWSRCVKEDPECFSERARRGIDAFGKMLRSFPIDDPLDETILETLNQVRGKFKTVVALLGMHHEYNDATDDQPTMTF